MNNQLTALQIRVQGIVQGVGFRPFVWHIAHLYQVKGEVWNDSGGVTIQAWATDANMQEFLQRLENDLPPLAQVDQISTQPLKKQLKLDDFTITASHQGQVQTNVSPDAATCPECLKDTLNPKNRRYHYPFTNCTHCGPRLSIIKKIPYDRGNTSMGDFPLCDNCRKEYENPADRRFHAQPNACEKCGPHIWLADNKGQQVAIKNNAIASTAELLQQGKIIAIKGLGGIHLACDASNAQAVQTLRQRKKRYAKAFALMASNVEMIRHYAKVNSDEEQQLQDKSAPIVILQAINSPTHKLPKDIAPGQNGLGFMLPYTPLHHLLMTQLTSPIVLTSGNSSDEPQCIDNKDALTRLQSIADYFLLHNRDIVNRLDDSVLRLADQQVRIIRRARGYAPAPIKLPRGFENTPEILAMGAELKNTFCLLKDGQAILSQHMGDLENATTLRDYHHNLTLYHQLFEHNPQIIVVDKHPDYFSTQAGQQLAAEKSLELISVQHHHAHIAACMAEYQLPIDHPMVLGIALDGLGYGEDQTIWGGEFLLCDYQGFRRQAWFQPVPMLGGAKAMYEPWRNTLAHLWQLDKNELNWEQLNQEYGDLEIFQFLNQKPLSTLKTMANKGLNSPLASSAGRFFDAVAATLGLCTEQAVFEGQAAIELESQAETVIQSITLEQSKDYIASIEKTEAGYVFNWQPIWLSILRDMQQGIPIPDIAAYFHLGLAQSLLNMTLRLAKQLEFKQVVLTGGVFQNRLLLENTSLLLREKGFQVLSPRHLPANDGGLSLGQIVIGACQKLSIRKSN